MVVSRRPSRRGGLSRRQPRQSDAVNTFACCSLYDISRSSISTSSSQWSAGEASADVHRLARVCADKIAGKGFRKGLIDADSVEDAAAMIQAQIYRWIVLQIEQSHSPTPRFLMQAHRVLMRDVSPGMMPSFPVVFAEISLHCCA